MARACAWGLLPATPTVGWLVQRLAGSTRQAVPSCQGGDNSTIPFGETSYASCAPVNSARWCGLQRHRILVHGSQHHRGVEWP